MSNFKTGDLTTYVNYCLNCETSNDITEIIHKKFNKSYGPNFSVFTDMNLDFLSQ